MKDLCDCIIPFYNEGLRVLHVVESVVKVKTISKIIVVDDGSDDRKTYRALKEKYSRVTSVRLEDNCKSLGWHTKFDLANAVFLQRRGSLI